RFRPLHLPNGHPSQPSAQQAANGQQPAAIEPAQTAGAANASASSVQITLRFILPPREGRSLAASPWIGGCTLERDRYAVSLCPGGKLCARGRGPCASSWLPCCAPLRPWPSVPLRRKSCWRPGGSTTRR